MSDIRSIRTLAFTTLVGCFFAFTTIASAEDFYKDRKISLIVGYSAGGGYDTYTRLLAKHLRNHIPGNPNIIVQNMPGAGSTKAAFYLANVAPKDGTVFGTFSRALPLAKLLGTRKLKHDPFALTYLGSLSSYKNDSFMILVRSDSPYKTVKDLQDASKPVAPFSGTAPGSALYDIPFLLKTVLGLRVKMIAGYPGSRQGALALDRNEVTGMGLGLSAVMSTQPDWITKKKVRALVQFGRTTRHPDLKNVPTAQELAPNAEILAQVKLMEAPLFMARPYAAPPGLPAERTELLRKAFMATALDPAFIAEGKRLKVDISPIDGEAVSKILEDLKKTPPAVLAKYKAIMDSRPPLPMVKHTGPVTKVTKSVWITFKGKNVMAKVSGARTKIMVNGNKAKRNAILVGMTCTFTYAGPGNRAKAIDCKS